MCLRDVNKYCVIHVSTLQRQYEHIHLEKHAPWIIYTPVSFFVQCTSHACMGPLFRVLHCIKQVDQWHPVFLSIYERINYVSLRWPYLFAVPILKYYGLFYQRPLDPSYLSLEDSSYWQMGASCYLKLEQHLTWCSVKKRGYWTSHNTQWCSGQINNICTK